MRKVREVLQLKHALGMSYRAISDATGIGKTAAAESATEKKLLLKHLKSAKEDGAPMSELIQVLPGKNRDHIKRLLEQLRDDGRAHVPDYPATCRILRDL